jgi:hypothetical protein
MRSGKFAPEKEGGREFAVRNSRFAVGKRMFLQSGEFWGDRGEWLRRWGDLQGEMGEGAISKISAVTLANYLNLKIARNQAKPHPNYPVESKKVHGFELRHQGRSCQPVGLIGEK